MASFDAFCLRISPAVSSNATDVFSFYEHERRSRLTITKLDLPKGDACDMN